MRLADSRIFVKKQLLKTIFNFGGFTPFHWANRKKVLILTYHRFSRSQNASKVSAADFDLHLQYLSLHNSVMPLAAAVECLRSGKSLPTNATVVTIDDGYGDAYEIAFPKLKKYGFPATVYAITKFLDHKIWLWTDLMRYVMAKTSDSHVSLEFGPGDWVQASLIDPAKRLETANRINERLKKLPNEQKEAKIAEIARQLNVDLPTVPTPEFAAMTWDQAREMEGDGVSIESHTVTHPILTNIGQAELDFELQTSKTRIEEQLGRRVDHFCYPNGSLNDNVRRAAEKAGYVSAVTTAYGFNDRDINACLLKRIDAQSGIESFAQSASGFEAVKQRVFAART
jgi:peptidoglycan/xylan/chitin deacetylase (PgdA/CDA1 family)